jgi:hypothetical protein
VSQARVAVSGPRSVRRRLLAGVAALAVAALVLVSPSPLVALAQPLPGLGAAIEGLTTSSGTSVTAAPRRDWCRDARGKVPARALATAGAPARSPPVGPRTAPRAAALTGLVLGVVLLGRTVAAGRGVQPSAPAARSSPMRASS